MSLSELLVLCGYSIFAVITAYGYGNMVLNVGMKLLGEKCDKYLSNIGAKILLGLGLFGNISLTLGLAGLFDKSYIAIATLPGFLFSIRSIWVNYPNWNNFFKKSAHQLHKDIISILLAAATIFILGMLFLAAMRPPHATDELHYHFPQAREVATSGVIKHSWDGHYFYGNIPKLIDVMFATGLEMQGYQLAHILNYLFLVGFVTLVYEVFGRIYGVRAGAFASLLLVLFSDYTWNATVGFVDSATSSLEISSLIFTSLWLKRGKSEYLMISGILLGLALGSKYSPLPTALFLTLVILHASWKKKNVVSSLLTFSVPALIMGGYWYIKNWILFGNPFYPMYFGHKGVSEESYLGLMEAIWQWEPKTLPVFLEKLKRWLTYTDATTYISIWIAPLIILWHRTDAMIKLLLSFYILYVPYWFFLATHQTRFLLSALLISNILLAIILSKLPTKILILGTAVLIISGLIIRPYPGRNLLEHYLWIKLHVVERQFALGNLSEKEFLEREFGCYYSTVDYLISNNLAGDVIDNWSLYYAPSVAYYSRENSFRQYKDLSFNELGKFEYYFVDESTRDRLMLSSEKYAIDNKELFKTIEEHIVSSSELLYQKDSCYLYKLAN